MKLCHDPATFHTAHQSPRQQILYWEVLDTHNIILTQISTTIEKTAWSYPENLPQIYLGTSLANFSSPNPVTFSLKSSSPFQLKN